MPELSIPTAVVADDDDDLRTLIAISLRKAGFEVEAVDNGTDAVAAIRESRPDVAVLDVSMPGLSGLDVLAEVRADESLADCRILLLTGWRRGEEPAGGADDYLAKPFSPRELVVRAQALVERS